MEHQQDKCAPRVGSLEYHVAALDQKTKDHEAMIARQQQRGRLLFDNEAISEPEPAPTASAPQLQDLQPPAPPGIEEHVEAAAAAQGPAPEEQAESRQLCRCC